MKAALCMEAIGDHIDRTIRAYRHNPEALYRRRDGWRIMGTRQTYWCAELVPLPGGGYDRRFLRGRKDYSEADDIGNRGVYVWYLLEPGRVYEAQRRLTWSTSERFYCRAVGGQVVRITREEVEEWLAQTGASSSTSMS